ncbi:hypothetical protein D018_0065B, partial [Vibrio parahaemolyticus VP2007-007]
HQVR